MTQNRNQAGATTRRGRWDFGSPYPMRLRIVRFQLNTGEFETIATSLPPTFTVEEIRQLYHMRWGIETGFRGPDVDAAALMRNMAKHLVPIRQGRQDQRKIKPKSFVGFTY